MQIVTYIMLGFGVIAALDRIFGSKLGLGNEFEKGINMLGTLTLSMAGMLVMAPLISRLLSGIGGFGPFDISIIPASLLANDMGGAHLAAELCGDADIGRWNGLVVSSMMGCTVSFTLPYVLQATDKKHHGDVLFGLLCGIVTVPVGALVGGLMLGLKPVALIVSMLPLLLLCALIALGLVFFKAATVKVFTALGYVIKAFVTVGLISGIAEYLTGFKAIPHTGSLDSAMDIIINIACIMVGAFALLNVVKKLLSPLLCALGKRAGLDSHSVFGFLSTVGTSVSTFESVDKMSRRGVVINSAFAVAASFVFVDHLAFTLSFDPSCVPAMIVSKLISGACATALAAVLYKE